MQEIVTLRFKNGPREVEVQASPALVAEWWERVLPYVAGATDLRAPVNDVEDAQPTDADDGEGRGARVPSTFGEYLHELPDSVTDLDRVLIAGHFLQSQSEQNAFTTAAANDLLKSHGIKLANPSSSVRRNESARRLFRIGEGVFRVSENGVQYLRRLLDAR